MSSGSSLDYPAFVAGSGVGQDLLLPKRVLRLVRAILRGAVDRIAVGALVLAPQLVGRGRFVLGVAPSVGEVLEPDHSVHLRLTVIRLAAHPALHQLFQDVFTAHRSSIPTVVGRTLNPN